MKNKELIFFLVIFFLISLFFAGCDLFFWEDTGKEEDTTDNTGNLYIKGYMDIASPSAIAISPDGRHFYVNSSGGTPGIYWVTRDLEDGMFTINTINDYVSISGTVFVLLSPDGKQLYTNDSSSNLICAQIGAKDGALSELQYFNNGFNVFAGVMPPDGNHLYVSDGANIYWYPIDRITGHLSAGGSFTPPFGLSNLAVSPDGKYIYGLAGDNIYWLTRDFNTGGLTYKGSDFINFAGAHTFNSMTISPDGRHAYTCANGSMEVGSLQRDPGSGKLSSYNTEIWGNNHNGVTVAPDGKNVYCSNDGMNEVSWGVRNKKSGEFDNTKTSGNPGNVLNMVNCVIVAPDGNHVYASAGNGGTGSGAVVVLVREKDSE